MSQLNPFLGEINFKVMPHEDRKPGKVISYTLTPEEIQQRYGKPSDIKRTKTGFIYNREHVKEIRKNEKESVEMIKSERLEKGKVVELIKKLGWEGDAKKKVAELLGVNLQHLQSFVCYKKILDELGIEKKVNTRKDAVASEPTAPVPEVIKQMAKEEEPIESVITMAPPKRFGLKPVTMVSRDIHFEYALMAEELVICNSSNNGESFPVLWEDLQIFIEELQDLKKMMEKETA